MHTEIKQKTIVQGITSGHFCSTNTRSVEISTYRIVIF